MLSFQFDWFHKYWTLKCDLIYSLLEIVQNRLRRIGEELIRLDAVFSGMKQLQVELEEFSLQVANFDSFHKDVDRVDADLLVSPASNS